MSGTYVVRYTRGPAWVAGKPVWQQPLEAHGRHVDGLHLRGDLVVAGPFTDDSGGIAVFRAASPAAARAFVDADPAVADRVFDAEVHPLFPVAWDEYGSGAVPSFIASHVLPALCATPHALAAIVGRLPETWLAAAPAGGGWSPREVVAHLLHGEETDWIPRARIVLEQGGTRAFDPFIRDAPPPAGTTAELLRRFTVARRANVRVLRGMALTESDLARTGRHPELGPVTLRELLAAWAAHDLGHIRQVCRVLAGGLRTDVGPWAAYLPVVREQGGDSGDPAARAAPA
jgi:uncharacterized protein YciI